MNSSAVLQDRTPYINQPLTAIVQQAPAPLISNYQLLFEQNKKTGEHGIEAGWPATSSVVEDKPKYDLNFVERASIVANAQKRLGSDNEDLDPVIQKLVSDNFKDLIWR